MGILSNSCPKFHKSWLFFIRFIHPAKTAKISRQAKIALRCLLLDILAALIYNGAMKKLLFLIFTFCLCSCGPREPGQGLAADPPPARGGYGAAESMRLPLTGSNHNERLLYYYNRPEMVDTVRRWQNEQFRRHNGENPADAQPAFQGMERTPSPFRQ